MDRKFTIRTLSRTASPRSRRLRDLPSGGSATGSGTVGSASGGAGAGAYEGHSHANKSVLDAIGSDAEGYHYVTRRVELTDPATGESEPATVREKVKAGYADLAHDLAADSPAAKRFLSRIADDIAEGHITFQQGLSAIGAAIFQDGATFGEFIRSLYAGKGAGIDKDGNAEFQSVRVRGYFEAMEYIVNRLAAIEGDQLLTEGDTIDRVTDLGDGTFGLYLHSKWEGYFTAQAPGSVLKGIINSLAAGSGVYYTCWLRVNSVNQALNYIEVSMYPDAEVPGGRNFPPCELMKIARWGHQTDPRRQSCLYLSSSEGRIVKLTGVTRPIIDKSNYGATFGSVPEWLTQMNLPLVEEQDYVYARGLIVQDLIIMDYQGKPVPTIVDRGAWSPVADYFSSSRNPATGVFETSDVWYMGCRYRCMSTGTHSAPAWNNTDWAMVEGNPAFMVEFAQTETLLDPDNIDLTLQVIAWLHNIDITEDIRPEDVLWTRYSEDAQGVERVASDNAWALRRAGAGKSLRLSTADMDFDGYMPRTIRFTATVTLRDGMGNAAAVEEARFEC